ncbi:hypothetical protein C8Q77DRAFT_1068097 [Trametes polyzona]|nr:hypothetical protein C8Q77DRAFT_1068097 [Trametes polyzona]
MDLHSVKRGHAGYPVLEPTAAEIDDVLPSYEDAAQSSSPPWTQEGPSGSVHGKPANPPLRSPKPHPSGSAKSPSIYASSSYAQTTTACLTSVPIPHSPTYPTNAPSASSPSSSVSRSTSSASASPSTHAPSTPHSHPSFERRPPPDVPYGEFPPGTHYARSDDLTRGFPAAPPTCPAPPGTPHPFSTHDVQEADWVCFLSDVQSAGGLTPVDPLIADAAPSAVKLGLGVVGYFASKALKAHVKSKRKSPVADVIDLWNRRFFHPRCMDVVLAQGAITYTGPMYAMPADMVRPTPSRRKDQHVKVLDRAQATEDEGRHTGLTSALEGVGVAVGAVSAAHDHIRPGGSGHKSRLEFGLDLKHSAGERWRLVVSYKPPVL